VSLAREREALKTRESMAQAATRIEGPLKRGRPRLGLSHSTVKHHLANARSKVGATTTAQLARILAERLSEPGGLAQPDE
jgi:hypothetical protein